MTAEPPLARAPGRRALVQGAAWALPVVTVAAAAPAIAASLASVSDILGGCRVSSATKTYRLSLTVCNESTTQSLVFTVGVVTMGGTALTNVSVSTSPTQPAGNPTSVSIGPGTVGTPNCVTVYIYGVYGAASTGSITATATYTLSGTTTGSGTSTGSFDLTRGC